LQSPKQDLSLAACSSQFWGPSRRGEDTTVAYDNRVVPLDAGGEDTGATTGSTFNAFELGKSSAMLLVTVAFGRTTSPSRLQRYTVRVQQLKIKWKLNLHDQLRTSLSNSNGDINTKHKFEHFHEFSFHAQHHKHTLNYF
jgi:hypothetical protein